MHNPQLLWCWERSHLKSKQWILSLKNIKNSNSGLGEQTLTFIILLNCDSDFKNIALWLLKEYISRQTISFGRTVAESRQDLQEFPTQLIHLGKNMKLWSSDCSTSRGFHLNFAEWTQSWRAHYQRLDGTNEELGRMAAPQTISAAIRWTTAWDVLVEGEEIVGY